MTIMIAALVGGALAVVVIVLLGKLRAASGARSLPAVGGQAGVEEDAKGAPGAGHCPLCSSALGPGERIKSDIYPGKGDRIMRIFGCPHCLPSSQGPASGRPRVCPVCRKQLPPEGWLVARYFERPGRRHVHVLGCAACRPSGGGVGRNR